MINCRICIRRSVQNYGRVLWSVVSCAPVRTHTPLFSRAAWPTRPLGPPASHLSPESLFIYIFTPPNGSRGLQSRYSRARARHPTQFLEAYTLQHRRPAARAHATAHTTVALLLPDGSLPALSLSLSAPPGHRALTETPARDVLEIWPRRRPGARARPLPPLVSRVASSVERPQAFFTTPTLAARRHRSCSTYPGAATCITVPGSLVGSGASKTASWHRQGSRVVR